LKKGAFKSGIAKIKTTGFLHGVGMCGNSRQDAKDFGSLAELLIGI
jgi:hypothetical protein